MAHLDIPASLDPRQAVADALYRCILGIDTNDQELFESAYLHDESASFVLGPVSINGWNNISKFLSRVFELTTTHFVTNVRVKIKGDLKTAYMTAHVLAYHMLPEDALKVEDKSYTAGCLYFIDLVKNDADGSWKIKRWEIKQNWTTGDAGVMQRK